jgi:hypothetical protein
MTIPHTLKQPPMKFIDISEEVISSSRNSKDVDMCVVNRITSLVDSQSDMVDESTVLIAVEHKFNICTYMLLDVMLEPGVNDSILYFFSKIELDDSGNKVQLNFSDEDSYRMMKATRFSANDVENLMVVGRRCKYIKELFLVCAKGVEGGT